MNPTPEENPMSGPTAHLLTATQRSVIDHVHAEAIDLVDAAVNSDQATVSAIASRSVDPAMLAGVTAVLAARFASSTERPEQEVADLRRLLVEDVERQAETPAGAGPQDEPGTAEDGPVLNVGDYRRAAALLWFTHAEPNDQGLMAVLEEAQEEHRSAQVVLAVLGLAGHAAPHLRTEDGRAWMRMLLDTAVSREADDLTQDRPDDGQPS